MGVPLDPKNGIGLGKNFTANGDVPRMESDFNSADQNHGFVSLDQKNNMRFGKNVTAFSRIELVFYTVVQNHGCVPRRKKRHVRPKRRCKGDVVEFVFYSTAPHHDDTLKHTPK
jgi:hypothetical protein